MWVHTKTHWGPSAYASPGVEIRARRTMPSNFQMQSGAVLRPPCLYRSTLQTEVCFLLWSIYILRQDIAMWPRLTDCDPPASTSHHWTVSASLCLSKVCFESILFTTGRLRISHKIKDSSHYCVLDQMPSGDMSYCFLLSYKKCWTQVSSKYVSTIAHTHKLHVLKWY